MTPIGISVTFSTTLPTNYAPTLLQLPHEISKTNGYDQTMILESAYSRLTEIGP